MAVAAQSSVSKPAAVRPGRRRSGFPLFALLSLLAAVLAAASARADLYQWTDEDGRTVISDMLPVDPGKVSGMKLLARASKPLVPAPETTSPPAADAKQQQLEARVEELERQLQEQQSAPPPVPAGDGDGYYPAPESSGYAPAYGPVYYPAPYYVSPPVVSVIVVPARPALYRPHPAHRQEGAARPVFASRPQFTGPTPQFIGSTPQFTGPTPRFTGPTPRFAGAAPQFLSPQGSGEHRHSAPRPIPQGGLMRAPR